MWNDIFKIYPFEHGHFKVVAVATATTSVVDGLDLQLTKAPVQLDASRSAIVVWQQIEV
jgi:hypothetical protein